MPKLFTDHDLGKPVLAQIPTGRVIPVGILVEVMEYACRVEYDRQIFIYTTEDLFIVDEVGSEEATTEILRMLAW